MACGRPLLTPGEDVFGRTILSGFSTIANFVWGRVVTPVRDFKGDKGS